MNQEVRNKVDSQTDVNRAIVIVTYNNEETITDCLESLGSTLGAHDEVAIVDNDSIDDTVGIVNHIINGNSAFQLIKNRDNLGFSEATNVGIRATTAPYVVLLNPDTILTPKWLDRIQKHFDAAPNIGAVGPISNWAAGNQMAKNYAEEDISSETDIKKVAERYYNWREGITVETKMLIGFCMMLKRDVLNRLGLLDKNLFLGMDDIDISWRLRLAGYLLAVASDTFIYHVGQHSFRKAGLEKTDSLGGMSASRLYNKLQSYYGEENVPTPMELWDMDWYTAGNAHFDDAERFHVEGYLFNNTYNKEYKSIASESKKNSESIILISGMHRSGTSAITGLLNLCGFSVGTSHMMHNENKSAFDNEKGHFENLGAVALNESILAESGGSWVSPPPLEKIIELSPIYKNPIIRFNHSFNGNLIKDPRFCFTLGIWKQYLSRLKCVLICLRHPLSVAGSLEKRNNFTIEAGLNLWKLYHTYLFDNLKGVPAYVVDYDYMTSHPEEELRNLLSTLKSTLTQEQMNEKISGFFESRLNHNPVSRSDTDALPQDIRELYELLKSQTFHSLKAV